MMEGIPLESTIQDAFAEESDRLDQVLHEIDTQLAHLRSVPVYHGHDYTEQVLESIRETKRTQLAAANGEPYFGRLDFHENGRQSAAPLYIGKVGVDKESGELAVIDWRAPVASLFYSFTGGLDPITYESPEGVIEGLVYLKRNIVIRKRLLQRVVDTFNKDGDQLNVTDEFLLYRLGENKDNKLRDIVSTIQAEQDHIIRAEKNTALLIQGVAGSGKTTVALHRLAYLLYRYREQVRAEKMIILAPNRMFLDYISGVLPELGVGHIQQTTFGDWSLELLEHDVSLNDPAKRLRDYFAVGPDRPDDGPASPARFKGSLAFMRWLEKRIDEALAVWMPKADFIPWEGAALKHTAILGWYDTENKHYPPIKRRERVIARIKRWVEMELNKTADPNRRKDRKKKASAKLREYEKLWPAIEPFGLYKQMLTAEGKPPWLSAESYAELPESVRSAAVRDFRKKLVDPEDLAPLVYVWTKLNGIESSLMLDHTVIDEAQDFSPFQVELLHAFTRNDSFTILGDLSQGIHSYQGIESWNEFSSLFADDRCAYFQLERSYRSTTEIIYFANEVLKRSGLNTPLAVPVFRSGEPVSVTTVAKGRLEPTVIQTVRDLQQKQTITTIAVIGRTEAGCKALHKRLTDAGLEANLIEAKQQAYKGGLSVVPVYLSKGLEFDAVIIADTNDANYEQTGRDAKLLYVGCTRALHELHLFHSAEASPLIRDFEGDFVVRRQQA